MKEILLLLWLGLYPLIAEIKTDVFLRRKQDMGSLANEIKKIEVWEAFESLIIFVIGIVIILTN